MPPPDVMPARAFDELCQSLEYGRGSVLPSHLAPLDIDLLSLPAEGNSALDIATLWGEGGETKVEEFCEISILPIEKARPTPEWVGPRRPYFDDSLRSQKKYVELIKRMMSSGMLDFADSCTEVVGIFAVRRKSGKQRLIVDARRSNQHFTEPKTVHFASADAFTLLSLEEGGEMYVD